MAARRNIADTMNPDSPGVEGSLRDGAENQLARFPEKLPGLKGQTPDQLIHELQVHQIELEMQAEELRRAHLELEESRDKYLDLYEFAPLGYLTLNNEAVISRANLTAATLLGVERSGLINKRFRTLIVGEDLEIWDRYFINLLNAEKNLTATLMLKKGDKAAFHARLEGMRLADTIDGPSIRVAISDITEIRQAERDRRESEHLLKSVIEILPVGVLILDQKGAVLAVNPEAERIWGRARSMGIGQFPEYPCWRLEDGARIEPQDWAGARAIAQGETTLEEQIEIECYGGGHKVVLNSALPIRRGDGVVSGAVVVTQDVTDGKAAEERIRWLASFPEMNPDPIIELDAGGCITYANPATRTILKALELPDDPGLFSPWDKEEVICLLKEGSENRIYREISLGREQFAEDIVLDTGLQVVRIYARNTAIRRS
jgi:PAS domain S-box-containing protein